MSAESLQSAIYIGRVRHRRRTPRHEFEFPLFMVYLDLDELDRVFSLTRLWGRSKWCAARFKREDYLSREGLGLRESILKCVEEQTGRKPVGRIGMLTHLRYFGHIFNPVTFYYCFGEDGRIEAIVSEITNTPWRERHAYALDAAARLGGDDPVRPLRWRFWKDFHVSPFLPVGLEYDWTFASPGPELLVHMNVRDRREGEERVFDATLRMERRELSPWRMRWMLARYPFMTLRVVGRIHFEALRLWIKGAKVYPHPEEAEATNHTDAPMHLGAKP